jgi:hypothetical protein
MLFVAINFWHKWQPEWKSGDNVHDPINRPSGEIEKINQGSSVCDRGYRVAPSIH